MSKVLISNVEDFTIHLDDDVKPFVKNVLEDVYKKVVTVPPDFHQYYKIEVDDKYIINCYLFIETKRRVWFTFGGIKDNTKKKKSIDSQMLKNIVLEARNFVDGVSHTDDNNDNDSGDDNDNETIKEILLGKMKVSKKKTSFELSDILEYFLDMVFD